MKQFNKIKEFIGGLSSGLRKVLLFGFGGLIVFAVILALVLNTKGTDPYVTLFSGLNEQESSEVMAKLHDTGVDYHYQPDGRITVPADVADKTRAALAVAGFPKSGSSYDTFLLNANMMSTEADKKSLKVWQAEQTLATTIRYMDGVDSARVQLALGESQKYVLDNSNQAVPTASVMVIMKDGGSPTDEQVLGVQKLVSSAVSNMNIGDVAVIDGNGIDVSVKRNDKDRVASDAKMEFEEKVQQRVENNILNLLEDMFGRNNVRVSAICKADMQKTISEERDYTAPNVEQNAGYIAGQSLTSDNSTADGTGGVPGADTNANIPQYNTMPGAGQANSSNTSDTEYALNERKVQSQNEAGTITDLSVAISINTQDLGVDRAELINLVANAAGIDPVAQPNKIVILNSVWPTTEVPKSEEPIDDIVDGDGGAFVWKREYIPYAIGAGVAALLLLILSIILIRRSRRRAAELEEAMMQPLTPVDTGIVAEAERPKLPPITVEDERGREMKENIRGFAEENPEISAQLLKSWLRGGEGNA